MTKDFQANSSETLVMNSSKWTILISATDEPPPFPPLAFCFEISRWELRPERENREDELAPERPAAERSDMENIEKREIFEIQAQPSLKDSIAIATYVVALESHHDALLNGGGGLDGGARVRVVDDCVRESESESLSLSLSLSESLSASGSGSRVSAIVSVSVSGRGAFVLVIASVIATERWRSRWRSWWVDIDRSGGRRSRAAVDVRLNFKQLISSGEPCAVLNKRIRCSGGVCCSPERCR